MIEVKNLTKRYGKQLALDNVSFSVKTGEILGFLGPNGAGKSTTMNIITGYISSDSGEVLIAGKSILDDPKDTKKSIGYLPELPPLYNDMTVKGYLEFIFDLKRVRLPMKEHLAQIYKTTGLENVTHRIIKHLSKGYRQRVGLAQALIGDPPVLILDEPSSGLDPAQIIEMRNLIRELGQKHTVILSSHVLTEIQAVCDRIIIINNGRIAASGSMDELTGTGKGTKMLRIIAEGREQGIISALRNIDGVSEVYKKGETEKGCYEFLVESTKDIRRAVFRAMSRTDFSILLMQPAGHSLEELFLGIISEHKAEKED